MLALIAVLGLELAGIFTVDLSLAMPAIISSILIEAAIVVVVKVCGYQKRWIKYFVMSCCILAITSFGIFYTYHSILLSVLPLFYAIQYTDKKVLRLTMILSILSIFFVVMGGYYWGLCDANMLLLTIGRTKEYIDPITGGLKFIEVNTNPWISLPLFYIFPRCVVLCFFVPVIKVVSQHITKSAYREQEIIIRSEYDEMTGLYNRNKFNEMVMEYYPTLDEIGILFIDINYLKEINDIYGHEEGDCAIKSVAGGIQRLLDERVKGYRVGGDEFVVIIEENNAIITLNRMKEELTSYMKGIPLIKYRLEVAVGLVSGSGKHINELIKEADLYMYEDKRKLKQK